MSVTVNENGCASTISDEQWFSDLRSSMAWAFAPVSPALVTMFWFNQAIDNKLCSHPSWECCEDGWRCVRCKTTKDEYWGPVEPTDEELAFHEANEDTGYECHHCGADCSGECDAPDNHPLRRN